MQKQKKSPRPKGKSKYQAKLMRRRTAALKLGLPGNSPWPVVWAEQKDRGK